LTRKALGDTIQKRREVNKTLEPNELAHLIVNLVSDKKGADITLLDTRAVSAIADYLVIATGESDRQLNAIADDIQKELKQYRILPLGVEGSPESGWKLLDYNSVIVHLFSPALRDYYLIENVHENTPVVVKMP